MTALERWRLILGEPAAPSTGELDETGAARDVALEWLYGRDPEPLARGERRAGGGAPALTTVDWLDEVHRLFPKETAHRLERDALDCAELADLVTDPVVLARVRPNPALLRAVLRTRHLMNPEVLELARGLVARVVAELTERLATGVAASLSGVRGRAGPGRPQARNFDFHATVRANLGNYRPELGRIAIDRPRFTPRVRRHGEPWQLILLVDQSASMAGSVIHAAVTAACLWRLPGLRTHLVAFDTDLADLTEEVADPVELLMKVQLGGGTDIARAVAYGASLVDRPKRAVLVVISDFFEGGNAQELVRQVRRLTEQGTRVLGLAALDEEAEPDYDRQLAIRLAGAGAQMGAMTPGQLAAFVVERIAG